MTTALVCVLVVMGVAVLFATRLAWARQQERDRCTFSMLFPGEVRPDHVGTFLAALSGRIGETVTVEVSASAAGIVHRLIVSAAAADALASQLRAAIPGIRLLPERGDEEEPVLHVWACELGLTSPGIPLRSDDPAGTSAAILAGLSSASSGPVHITMQWTLTPKRRVPLLVPAQSGTRSFEGRLAEWLNNLLHGRRVVSSSEELGRLTDKAKTPLFRAALRVGVWGDVGVGVGMEQAGPVLSAVGSVRASGVDFRGRLLPPPVAARRMAARRIPALVWPILVNTTELTALLGWPLDSPIIPGLTVGGTPHLPPVAALPETGLVLAQADFPGMERPVAIGYADALRHIYIPGPTGTGKSTLALNLVTQEMAAGHGVLVMDPKGDLINDLLERIPLEREGDVIIVDPLDSRPVGLNLLDGPVGEEDLTADQVVGVFARRFGSAWGPRTDDIARAAVLTLLADHESTLADLPALFTVPAFRRSLVGRVTAEGDPALAQFWQGFESWSEPEQAHNIAPLLNKARAVLMRRPVRAIVGQPSTISLDSVLREGRLLLVSLSTGLLGEDAAALLGGLLFARLWAAVQRRVALAPEHRRAFFATLDEFQSLVTIPTPLGDVLALARGYGLGLTLLHQHLGQLPADIRQAALANCRTKIVFAAGATDAAVLAREFAPWLDAPALVGLGAFEVVIGASIGASQLPPVTAVTFPPPAKVGHPERAALIRAASRQRYGREPAQIEARWRARINPDPAVVPIGRRRTPSSP